MDVSVRQCVDVGVQDMDDRRHVGVADVFGAEFSGDEQGCCRDVDVNVEVDGSGKLKGGINGGEH